MRFFSFLAVLALALSSTESQAQTPQVSNVIYIDEIGQLVYDFSRPGQDLVGDAFRIAVRAQTNPILFINNVGDTLGVAKQLFRESALDSAQVASLKDAPIELVAAPGAGRYLYPHRLVFLKTGNITYPTAGAEGYGSLRVAFTDLASGLLPGTTFSIWSVSRSGNFRLTRDPIPEAGVKATGYSLLLTSVFGGNILEENLPLKIGGNIQIPDVGETNEETWVGLWDGMATGARLKIVVWYQIFDTR